MANQGGNNNMLRDYRKGNWNLQETMVLIEAKKMDDQRRMKRVGESSERGKPAELRWKWVEDYCWKNGCLRSQNQCNDKWDNLMRDFKKVREYERRVAERGGEEKSYWRIDKNERKDNNLPSNMLPQIYEALVEVVERKGQREAAASGGAGSSRANVVPATSIVEKSAASHVLGHLSMPPPVQQYPIIQAPAMLLPLPPPAQAPAEPPTIPSSQPLPAVGTLSTSTQNSPYILSSSSLIIYTVNSTINHCFLFFLSLEPHFQPSYCEVASWQDIQFTSDLPMKKTLTSILCIVIEAEVNKTLSS